ncbi:MAG: hypothetical protein JW864_14670 [Spirochaetes bacterium]|nr:hypothetical protein [Spirochaetota bacterium]
MNLIVVSDIFGKTGELLALCESLKSPFDIIEPYSGKQMHFKDEPEAYDFFMNNIGIQVYSELLKDFVITVRKPSILVGFSIGATAVWNITEKVSSEIIKRSVCFYSSQIRNYTSITPAIETELIFPLNEQKFSIMEISDYLSKKKNVKIYNTCYSHGFMNKLSKNFNTDGYQEYYAWLCSILK